MRFIYQLNEHMKKEYEDLVSYPFLRRGNYQFKVSVYKKNHVVVVANHLMNVDKFFVKDFTSLEEAAVYIEYIIQRDYYE